MGTQADGVQPEKEAATNLANLYEQYIVDGANQRCSVILPFAELQVSPEEIEGLAALAERRE